MKKSALIIGTFTRGENGVFTGKIESLKRFKNDASEVKTGFECGLTVRNFSDVKPGDVIEAFETEKVAAEALA